jgi:hypothetical protein
MTRAFCVDVKQRIELSLRRIRAVFVELRAEDKARRFGTFIAIANEWCYSAQVGIYVGVKLLLVFREVMRLEYATSMIGGSLLVSKEVSAERFRVGRTSRDLLRLSPSNEPHSASAVFPHRYPFKSLYNRAVLLPRTLSTYTLLIIFAALRAL